MAKKKATVQQTAAKRVLDVLHRKEAYSESTAVGYEAVSYTHLDVYKRQTIYRMHV